MLCRKVNIVLVINWGEWDFQAFYGEQGNKYSKWIKICQMRMKHGTINNLLITSAHDWQWKRLIIKGIYIYLHKWVLLHASRVNQINLLPHFHTFRSVARWSLVYGGFCVGFYIEYFVSFWQSFLMKSLSDLSMMRNWKRLASSLHHTGLWYYQFKVFVGLFIGVSYSPLHRYHKAENPFQSGVTDILRAHKIQILIQNLFPYFTYLISLLTNAHKVDNYIWGNSGTIFR